MFRSLAFSVCLTMLMVASAHSQEKNNPDAKKDSKPDKPKVGDMAPDWVLVGSDGKTYQLSSFKGKQGVVVAWYPAALTGG